MRKMVSAIALLLGCGSSVLRPISFEAQGATARVWAGSLVEGRTERVGGDNLCLILVRYADGGIVLGPMLERIDERPLELNPGRYTLLFDQCIYRGCGADDIALTFDAVGGSTYEVWMHEINMNEASSFIAYLNDVATPNAPAISRDEKFCSHDL